MTDAKKKKLLATAVKAAYGSGDIMRRNRLAPKKINEATQRDIKLELDVRCQRKIESILTRVHPEIGILGEEENAGEIETELRWVVDPIDGTKSFVHGVPLYGVLIGVEIEGETVVGVINLPALDEMICAAKGLGCTLNGQPTRVSQVEDLGESLLCATDFESFDENGKGDAYRILRREVRLARGWGDCYGHVLVATGRAEIMLDPIMNVWDCAALLPIVEEAGGVYSDWNRDRDIRGDGAISTNGAIYEKVMSKLAVS